MEQQSEKRYILLAGIWIAIFCVAILLTGFCMTLYADDYNYAIYFKQGLSKFWNLTWQHYVTLNGRALVHFICEVVLLFGSKLFAVLNPVLLVLVCYLFARTMGREKRAVRLWYEILLSLIFIVNLDIMTARETLFWVTGSFNYLLPVILAVSALGLMMKAIQRGKVKLWEAIGCFLCGATTEQGGLIAFALVCGYSGYMTAAKQRIRGRRDGCILLPACIMAGYLSVLLAPGTIERILHGVSLFERLMSGDIWLTYMEISKDIFGPRGFGIYIALLLLGLGGLRCLEKELPRLLYLGFAIGCAIFGCVLLFQVQELQAYAALSLASVLYMAYTAVVLFRNRKYHVISFYLIAAILSQGIMLLVEKQMIRTVFPTALLLIACLSHLAIEILPRCMKWKWVSIGVCCLSVAGVVLFLPTLKGYYENTGINWSNEKSIREYKTTGSATYSLDIGYPYYYTMFYENGSFVPSFYTYYDLPEDAKIYYQSDKLPEVYLDGVLVTHPALFLDDAIYLPMQPVLTAGGGKVTWTPDQTEIEFRGKVYQIDNHTTEIEQVDTGQKELLEPVMKLAYGRQYIREDAMSRLFGVERQSGSTQRSIWLSSIDTTQ